MQWRMLCALLLMVVKQLVQGLTIDSPCSQRITHVSGEFTNQAILESNTISGLEIVPVLPFHGCVSINQDLTNRIALVQRGECNFVLKVWNAQRAGASAVVVMDSAARDAPPYHIIMQKDENVTHVHIPSVFISYQDGETLLHKIRQAAPWKPVLVSINPTGELTFTKSQYGWIKRVLTYFILVSSVCALSSGLSLVTSIVFAWIGTKWRTRLSRKLRVMSYRPNLLRELLEEALQSAHVLEYISLDDEEEHIHTVPDKVKVVSTSSTPAESCSICLEDFIVHEQVKVLPCNHFFHANCIEPWLEQRSGWCPLCKKNAIPIEQIPKVIFGFLIPPMEQILQQEHWLHTFVVMLPASFVSCIIVNVLAAMVRSLWP